MGVKGLTSFVRSASRAISDEVTLPVPNTSGTRPGPLVVDGWAWIYTIFLAHFPDNVRGGDYAGYSAFISSVVSALRSADLDLVFVFDGPYLPLKLPTVIKRSNDLASINSAFMRSTSRSSVRFQAQMGIVPPLLYDCTLETLRNEGVEIVIAECEADSAVAETAERMQGWALSNDSDFFILCSRGVGCKGYVPIDTLEYLVRLPSKAAPVEAASQAGDAQGDDDGFAQVGKKGRRGKSSQGAAASSLELPPETVASRPPQSAEEGELIGVRFSSYSPMKLASRLEIPLGMLPLFAAIVGNDYSSAVQTKILGQALPNGPDRITKVAAILKEERQRVASGRSTPATAGARSGASTPLPRRNGPLAFTARAGGMTSSYSSAASDIATPTRSGPHPAPDLAALPVDPVRDMVQGVVERILARAENTALARYVSSGEKAEVVDSIIESVCTYSLLTLSSAPHLSSPNAKFFNFSSSSAAASVSEERASLIREYQQLYASGRFDKSFVEALTQRFYLCKLSSEDPDIRSVQVTHARALRRWLWAVLFEVWGMDWARETMEEPEIEDDDGQGDKVDGEGRPVKLYGKGKSWIDEDGDDDELVQVQTPPSSVDGSSVAESDVEYSEDEAADVDPENLPSRPGSVNGDDEQLDEAEAGPKPPPAVVEYARRGDRLVGELCEILPIRTLLAESASSRQQELPAALKGFLSGKEDDGTSPSAAPVAGADQDTRLSLYLYAHCAPSLPSDHAWERGYLLLLATLRFLIICERERLGESYVKSNWTKLEIIAAILSATRPSYVLSLDSAATGAAPTTRSIHLQTSLQLTLISSQHLAQSLRLVPGVLDKTPSQVVNGEAFHRILLSSASPTSSPLERYEAELSNAERQMLQYVLQDGVDEMLSIDVDAIRREKKEAKKKEKRLEKVKKDEEERSRKKQMELKKAGSNAFAFLGEEDEGDSDEDEEEDDD